MKIEALLLNKTMAYLEARPYREVKDLLEEWTECLKQEPVEVKPDEE